MARHVPPKRSRKNPSRINRSAAFNARKTSDLRNLRVEESRVSRRIRLIESNLRLSGNIRPYKKSVLKRELTVLRKRHSGLEGQIKNLLK